ncbi:MAG: GNAT family N-acetyltransferase [Roseburia sp.]|nr:GNAT family N-acetyltransferase [Muribaculum sp.]MCM1440117.1 GNAT family N-acetyltransferase [Roseburia sp.]
MEIVFKKTNELSAEELNGIVELFERVFEKHRPEEVHIRQFINNPLGYSYHSMIMDNGKIVGINTYVPVYYRVNGEKILFANSIDSMVDKAYRDFFAYNDMVLTAYKEMKKEGVKFAYGYPNDNAFPVVTKSKLMKSIGRMGIYCLPYRIGGVKTSLGFLNPLSGFFCNLWLGISTCFASDKKFSPMVIKDAESYNATRYQRGDADYGHADLGNGELHYKITNHEGVRTAFIIDIDQKSPRNFNRAVRYLLRNHSKEFDLILYPGWLPFGNTGMIKLPRKLEPKNFNLTGKMLAKKGELPEEIWNIENWDTNLSNYDLI